MGDLPVVKLEMVVMCPWKAVCVLQHVGITFVLVLKFALFFELSLTLIGLGRQFSAFSSSKN